MRKRRWSLLAGAVVFAAAACAGDDAEDAGVAQDTLDAIAPAPAADPAAGSGLSTMEATLTEWEIMLSQDSVPAGAFTIQVRNTGSMPHAFEVEGNGQEFATNPLPAGAEVSMSLDLTAGEYKVYCPIDSAGMNHENQGMVTRLRVY